MDCQKIRKKFIFFIEKELPAEVNAEITNHLKTCKKCSELFENFSETYNSVDLKEEIEPKAFFTESVMGKILSEEKSYADDSSAFDILFSKFFKKIAFTGIAVIIAFVILFYVSEGTFSLNFTADNDELNTENVTAIFFDN